MDDSAALVKQDPKLYPLSGVELDLARHREGESRDQTEQQHAGGSKQYLFFFS